MIDDILSKKVKAASALSEERSVHHQAKHIFSSVK